MGKMIAKREFAWLATIFAAGFVAWIAMGMPIPPYRYLARDTLALKTDEWVCQEITVGKDLRSDCSLWRRRVGK